MLLYFLPGCVNYIFLENGLFIGIMLFILPYSNLFPYYNYGGISFPMLILFICKLSFLFDSANFSVQEGKLSC